MFRHKLCGREDAYVLRREEGGNVNIDLERVTRRSRMRTVIVHRTYNESMITRRVREDGKCLECLQNLRSVSDNRTGSLRLLCEPFKRLYVSTFQSAPLHIATGDERCTRYGGVP